MVDKAYANEARRQAALGRGIDWRVSRRASGGKRLNCADKSFNRKSNRTRARVEHAFGVIKHLWGYRKVRYRGVGEECGASVYPVCPGQFLSGQAGVGCHMRIDPCSGRQKVRTSPQGDAKT